MRAGDAAHGKSVPRAKDFGPVRRRSGGVDLRPWPVARRSAAVQDSFRALRCPGPARFVETSRWVLKSVATLDECDSGVDVAGGVARTQDDFADSLDVCVRHCNLPKSGAVCAAVAGHPCLERWTWITANRRPVPPAQICYAQNAEIKSNVSTGLALAAVLFRPECGR